MQGAVCRDDRGGWVSCLETDMRVWSVKVHIWEGKQCSRGTFVGVLMEVHPCGRTESPVGL